MKRVKFRAGDRVRVTGPVGTGLIATVTLVEAQVDRIWIDAFDWCRSLRADEIEAVEPAEGGAS